MPRFCAWGTTGHEAESKEKENKDGDDDDDGGDAGNNDDEYDDDDDDHPDGDPVNNDKNPGGSWRQSRGVGRGGLHVDDTDAGQDEQESCIGG